MATFRKHKGRFTATVRIKPYPSASKTFETRAAAQGWARGA